MADYTHWSTGQSQGSAPSPQTPLETVSNDMTGYADIERLNEQVLSDLVSPWLTDDKSLPDDDTLNPILDELIANLSGPDGHLTARPKSFTLYALWKGMFLRDVKPCYSTLASFMHLCWQSERKKVRKYFHRKIAPYQKLFDSTQSSSQPPQESDIMSQYLDVEALRRDFEEIAETGTAAQSSTMPQHGGYGFDMGALGGSTPWPDFGTQAAAQLPESIPEPPAVLLERTESMLQPRLPNQATARAETAGQSGTALQHGGDGAGAGTQPELGEPQVASGVFPAFQSGEIGGFLQGDLHDLQFEISAGIDFPDDFLIDPLALGSIDFGDFGGYQL